jgi:hypothetical protein
MALLCIVRKTIKLANYFRSVPIVNYTATTRLRAPLCLKTLNSFKNILSYISLHVIRKMASNISYILFLAEVLILSMSVL